MISFIFSTTLAERLLIFLFGTLCCTAVSEAFKPVVIVHGLLSTGELCNQMAGQVHASHPETNVTVLRNVKNKLETLESLKRQLNRVAELIEPIMRSSPSGIHLICHSQGKQH